MYTVYMNKVGSMLWNCLYVNSSLPLRSRLIFLQFFDNIHIASSYNLCMLWVSKDMIIDCVSWLKVIKILLSNIMR